VRDPRRSIPSVDRLLGSAAFAPLLHRYARPVVTAALQDAVGEARALTGGGRAHSARLDDPTWYAERVGAALDALATGSLREVLNATGVILHTNLGRAPLAPAALEAIRRVAQGYSTLEFDLATGARGSRYTHCRDLLVRLTGAEDALVVNNNAAALVLALNTTARGHEAIISRGELVEIGGAFRVPEIMERSGAQLREIGSTNRTHIEDYEAALSARTGALLKVHPSNFTMHGFTADVTVAELAVVARRADVPLIHDIGSGLLLDSARLGLPSEPTPAESIDAGADIVCMSGDKLLGGPQCGIILGGHRQLERMRANPLCRALRVDKLTLAALAATLRLYLDADRALQEIPVLRMLTVSPAELAARAAGFAERCRAAGVSVELRVGQSAVGGGAAPGAELPTTLVLLHGPAVELERALRRGSLPVIGRIVDDTLALDLRTLPPGEEARLLECVRAACAELQGGAGGNVGEIPPQIT
jgi:L-seryl-tRNA(Ser) seleniumtransferase